MKPRIKYLIHIEQEGRSRFVFCQEADVGAVVWHTPDCSTWYVSETEDYLCMKPIRNAPEKWRTELEAIGYAFQIVRNAAEERLNPEEVV